MPFVDVDCARHYLFILNAYNQGIIRGYNNGECKPDAETTHAQFLKMLIVAAGREGDLPANSAVAVEAWKGQWYGPYLQLAVNRGWIDSVSFPPDSLISRGICRLSGFYDSGQFHATMLITWQTHFIPEGNGAWCGGFRFRRSAPQWRRGCLE